MRLKACVAIARHLRLNKVYIVTEISFRQVVLGDDGVNRSLAHC